MSTILNYRGEAMHDPDERYGITGEPPEQISTHPLDDDESIRCLNKLEAWFDEARDAQSQSRFERMRDFDYYHGYQYDEETLAVLQERGQAPLVFNLVKQVIDWITGTERRTRIDWNVLPREENDVTMAQLKRELLKYVSDVNKAGWQRSRVFFDAVVGGVGWIEEAIAKDKLEEPLILRWQDWRQMWWDPYSRADDLSDCRYVIRSKWMDLDYALAAFPDRAAQINAAAINVFDGDYESLEDEAELPQVFGHVRESGRTRQYPVVARGTMSLRRRARQRVRIFEGYYRKPERRTLIEGHGSGFHGQVFNKDNKDHAGLLRDRVITTTEAVTDAMHYGLWIRGALLEKGASPYKHNRFPWTPCFAYRDDRDGQPYGAVRQIRDPQDDYNKRRSKAQFMLSTNRVLYEDGAIDEENEAQVLAEAARPDAQIRLRKGALSEGRFRIESGAELLQGQVTLMQEDKALIHESSGVTRDNVGQESGAISGRAILAKQQQGAVTTAALFDNYRLFQQLSGEKTLSNVEQFMSLPKKFRILGRTGTAEFLKINQPVFDPFTGKVEFLNDVTASQADFVIDQMDYRETARMAMAEQLFETIGKLPPENAMALLDIAIDMTDLPNKAEIANRIRAQNGQTAPGKEDTPEAQAAKAAQDAARQRAEELEYAEREANVGLKRAQTGLTQAKTRQTTVLGRRDALDTAGLIATALPLAPAADRLYEPEATEGAPQ